MIYNVRVYVDMAHIMAKFEVQDSEVPLEIKQFVNETIRTHVDTATDINTSMARYHVLKEGVAIDSCMNMNGPGDAIVNITWELHTFDPDRMCGRKSINSQYYDLPHYFH